ncbi:MAG: hypothetical protein V3U92_00010 [Cellulophaga sp.]
MKNRVLTFILISCAVLFTKCKSDDDTVHAETLNGVWNLKNVSGSLLGINIDYIKGQVEWDFDLENNILIIKNNIITTGPEDVYAGLDSGKYNIVIEENDGIETLFINDSKRGVIILLKASLKIDDGTVVDGLMTEFER